jgi:hypothetical protein
MPRREGEVFLFGTATAQSPQTDAGAKRGKVLRFRLDAALIEEGCCKN